MTFFPLLGTEQPAQRVEQRVCQLLDGGGCVAAFDARSKYMHHCPCSLERVGACLLCVGLRKVRKPTSRDLAIAVPACLNTLYVINIACLAQMCGCKYPCGCPIGCQEVRGRHAAISLSVVIDLNEFLSGWFFGCFAGADKEGQC